MRDALLRCVDSLETLAWLFKSKCMHVLCVYLYDKVYLYWQDRLMLDYVFSRHRTYLTLFFMLLAVKCIYALWQSETNGVVLLASNTERSLWEDENTQQ